FPALKSAWICWSHSSFSNSWNQSRNCARPSLGRLRTRASSSSTSLMATSAPHATNHSTKIKLFQEVQWQPGLFGQKYAINAVRCFFELNGLILVARCHLFGRVDGHPKQQKKGFRAGFWRNPVRLLEARTETRSRTNSRKDLQLFRFANLPMSSLERG